MVEKPSTMTPRTDTTNMETTRNAQYFTPRVDIFETDAELVMYADMPGVAPKSIDSKRIEAECKNGVLTVHLSKAASAKPKQVTVKAK